MHVSHLVSPVPEMLWISDCSHLRRTMSDVCSNMSSNDEAMSGGALEFRLLAAVAWGTTQILSIFWRSDLVQHH